MLAMLTFFPNAYILFTILGTLPVSIATSERSFRGGGISGVGNFHEFSFYDVIVLIQPWYNFFANGHI